MTDLPLGAANCHEAITIMVNNPARRVEFFSTPDRIDNLVQATDDLDWLLDQARILFNQGDRTSALTLMFHVFLRAADIVGLHDICDSIGLYMEDAANPDVCAYIKRYWTKLAPTLSDDKKSWWRKECEFWHCVLPNG